MARQRFDDALLRAVDFAFDSLGRSSKQALYFHLKATFHLNKIEIPDKVKVFDKAIKLIFKDGTVFLERLILEKLCAGLGVDFDGNKPFDFVKTVSRIRSMVSEEEPLFTVSHPEGEFTVVKSRKSR